MSERSTGGWLSSVVGNLSGLWSKPSSTSPSSLGQRESSLQNSSFEQQPDDDLGSGDQSIVVDSLPSSSMANRPTTSKGKSEIPSSRRTIRYLNPSLLSTKDSDKKIRFGGSRKRAATTPVFEDIEPQERNLNESSRMLEDSHGASSSKKFCTSQRDFIDERSHVSTLYSPSVSNYDRLREDRSLYSFKSPNSTMARLNVSKSASTTSSSLSSKTRAILEQLEKIASPAKEVKRVPSFSNTFERWSSNVFGSPSQRPPRNSLSAISRAQLISNTLSTKTRAPYWGRIAQTRNEAKKSVETTDSQRNALADSAQSDQVETSPVSKNSEKPSKIKSSEITTSESTANAFANVRSTTLATSISMSISPQRETMIVSPPKTSNIFSARIPELDIYSPKKTKEKKEKEFGARIDDSAFSFTPPTKRGPSVNMSTEVQEPGNKNSPFSKSVDDVAIVTTGQNFTCKKSVGIDEIDSVVQNKASSSPGTSDLDVNNQNAQQKSSSVAVDPAHIVSKKSPSSNWNCPDCMVPNKSDCTKCVCCGFENKPWNCNECWINNKATDSKCAACGSLKSGSSTTKTSTANTSSPADVFSGRTFKPMPSSTGFSFGFKPSKPATETTNIELQSKAVPKTVELGGVNGNMQFGVTASSSLQEFGHKQLDSQQPFSSTTLEAPTFGGKGSDAAINIAKSVNSSMPGKQTTVVVSTAAPSSSPFAFSSTPSTSNSMISSDLPRPSLSFTSLAPTTTSQSAMPKASFTLPVTSTDTNLFGFGSAESNKDKGSVLTFGAVNTLQKNTAVTAASSIFGSSSAEGLFSTPKKSLISDVNGRRNEVSQETVEMVSPVNSPQTTTTTAFSLSPTKPLFTFGSSNIPSTSTLTTATLFGNPATVQNSASSSLFNFGQQEQQNKSFSTPSVQPAFNFGAAPSNGGAGFAFGSASSPTNFAFGEQQPSASSLAAPFNFAAAAAPSFGSTPSTQNFFSVGSTSAPPARKMLRARRTRK